MANPYKTIKDFDPAVLKSFHEYVHGGIDRRSFLREISKFGLNSNCGLLVNASRSIIYASSGRDFASAANREAQILQTTMAEILQDIA